MTLQVVAMCWDDLVVYVYKRLTSVCTHVYITAYIEGIADACQSV